MIRMQSRIPGTVLQLLAGCQKQLSLCVYLSLSRHVRTRDDVCQRSQRRLNLRHRAAVFDDEV